MDVTLSELLAAFMESPLVVWVSGSREGGDVPELLTSVPASRPPGCICLEELSGVTVRIKLRPVGHRAYRSVLSCTPQAVTGRRVVSVKDQIRSSDPLIDPSRDWLVSLGLSTCSSHTNYQTEKGSPSVFLSASLATAAVPGWPLFLYLCCIPPHADTLTLTVWVIFSCLAFVQGVDVLKKSLCLHWSKH